MKQTKIFGLGLSRTGTTSLGLGLERLGFRTIHFPVDVYTTKDHKIYELYDAFVDLPIPLYYKQLDARFPGSKFILTTREEKKWLSSMQWMMSEGKIIWRHGKVHDALNKQMYGTSAYDEQCLLDCYHAYNQEIISYFKDRANDFLHIDLSKGELTYSTLCTFLGIEVPSEEFPKANEKRKASFWNRLEYFLWHKLPFYRKVRYVILKSIRK